MYPIDNINSIHIGICINDIIIRAQVCCLIVLLQLEALTALLADDNRFGFIVMDGNGALFGTLQVRQSVYDFDSYKTAIGYYKSLKVLH